MYWTNFLHIYQPAEQRADILEAVTAQSYRPFLKGLKAHKKVRLTLNINGSLLELFDRHGYHDVIDDLRTLGSEGRIEFTSSAKYHAFLPFLGKEEVVRQIVLNNETNSYFLGKGYHPQGFFPPEMAFKPGLEKIIEELGFKWMILDEIACGGATGNIDYRKLYKIHGTKLNVFFRERRISNLIMSATVRSSGTLKQAMEKELKNGQYLVTAMDGETFGHHRPGLDRLLWEMFNDPEFQFATLSDLSNLFREEVEIFPATSTWASSEEDIKRGVQFLSWSDPENPIHTVQHQFVALALREVYGMDKTHPHFKEIRAKMDMALASDHFWWASAKPWWSIEMIEGGAYRLLDIMRTIPGVLPEHRLEASSLYEKIVSMGFDWQRTGRIHAMMKDQNAVLRIPFKDRTLKEGGEKAEEYHAFVDMMKNLEHEASKRGEYEQAILWRDAVTKLEERMDIYDAIHVVDLLRMKIPNEDVNHLIEQYKKRYREIRGGQPEQRGA